MLSMAISLCGSMAARADNWQTGELYSHTQADWGSTQSTVLENNYAKVYASTFGTFKIGLPNPEYSAQWDSSQLLVAFFPQGGPYAPLNTDLVDPNRNLGRHFGWRSRSPKTQYRFLFGENHCRQVERRIRKSDYGELYRFSVQWFDSQPSASRFQLASGWRIGRRNNDRGFSHPNPAA
jgi:hypothetical protein